MPNLEKISATDTPAEIPQITDQSPSQVSRRPYPAPMNIAQIRGMSQAPFSQPSVVAGMSQQPVLQRLKGMSQQQQPPAPPTKPLRPIHPLWLDDRAVMF